MITIMLCLIIMVVVAVAAARARDQDLLIGRRRVSLHNHRGDRYARRNQNL
jgi:hypothetical protein